MSDNFVPFPAWYQPRHANVQAKPSGLPDIPDNDKGNTSFENAPNESVVDSSLTEQTSQWGFLDLR
jgi:hypothetical protein